MAKGQVIAVDWDHTCYEDDQLLPGVREAFDAFHDAGHRIIIFSCNNPKWIRQRCEELKLRPDYVWGETGLEGGKCVAALYVDDRGYQFTGWSREEVERMLERVAQRPVTRY